MPPSPSPWFPGRSGPTPPDFLKPITHPSSVGTLISRIIYNPYTPLNDVLGPHLFDPVSVTPSITPQQQSMTSMYVPKRQTSAPPLNKIPRYSAVRPLLL